MKHLKKFGYIQCDYFLILIMSIIDAEKGEGMCQAKVGIEAESRRQKIVRQKQVYP